MAQTRRVKELGKFNERLLNSTPNLNATTSKTRHEISCMVLLQRLEVDLIWKSKTSGAFKCVHVDALKKVNIHAYTYTNMIITAVGQI